MNFSITHMSVGGELRIIVGVRAHLRVDQPLLELFVKTFSQWIAPIAMVSPGNGAEVSDALADVCHGDMRLRVVADVI